MTLVLSSEQNSYIHTEFCLYEDKSGNIWNDPYIHIDWPLDIIDKIILSYKDKRTDLKESKYQVLKLHANDWQKSKEKLTCLCLKVASIK